MAAEGYAVTVAGAGTKAGTAAGVPDWDNAMDMAAWLNDMINNAEAGDIYYVEDGTYTTGGAVTSALDGTAALPIKVIGVKTGTTNEPPILSDWAIADADRPLLATEANIWRFNDYWQFYNFRKTGTGEWRIDLGGFWNNCKILNSNGGASLGLDFHSAHTHCIDCDVQSTNGTAIDVNVNGDGRSIIDSYIHDSSVKGIDGGTAQSLAVINTIIDTCGIGLEINGPGNILINSVIYNCTTGISDTGSFPNFKALNNSITSCTTGASWTALIGDSFWDYNNWHGNGADTVNVTKGLNALAVAPQYTNAPGGDFSIAPGSNMDDQAFKMRLGVG